MEDRLIKVTARIMGEDYTIRGRAPEEHIQRIARFVDEKMIQIAEAYPKLGTSRVAVLTAINTADELFKIKEQYEQLTRLLEEEWSQRHSAAGVSATGRAPAARPGRLPVTAAPPAPGGGPRSGQAQLTAFGDGPGARNQAAASSDRRLLTGDALAEGLPPRAPGSSLHPDRESTPDEDQ